MKKDINKDPLFAQKLQWDGINCIYQLYHLLSRVLLLVF